MYRKDLKRDGSHPLLLDGYGSYGPEGDWGGYWGKQGPEFLDRRLALYHERQRLVLGANTMRMSTSYLRLTGSRNCLTGSSLPVWNSSSNVCQAMCFS